MSKLTPAERLIAACHAMHKMGFLPGTNGNLSMRIDDDRYLITPAGVQKHNLKPRDLLVVDGSGSIIRGKGRSSSETPIHLACYAARADVKAVIHAHPPWATAITLAGISLEVPYLPEIVAKLGGIPTVPYATPGSKRLAKLTAKWISKYDALLLERHGTITTGSSIEQALSMLEEVEHCAMVVATARLLGKPRAIPHQETRGLLELLGL